MVEYNGATTRDYSKDRMPQTLPALKEAITYAPHTYNVTDSSMLRIRGKVARSQGLTAHNLILMGHSYFAGSNSVPGVTDFGTALKKSLKTTLGSEYAHSGIVMFRNGEARDTRYSAISAGWGTSNGADISAFATCNTASAELTFTSDTVGTIVQIGTYENSAAFTYSIDGAGPVTVNPLSGSVIGRIIQVTGLANTTHTVKIVASTASNTYFAGAGVFSDNGLHILNGGYGGSHAYDWSTIGQTTKRKMSQILAPNRDIVVLQLDTNDIRNGQTTSQWRNSMNLIITEELALGAGVVLIMSVDAPGVGGLTSAQWDTYYAVGYELADKHNIPLLDTREMFGGWTNCVSMGLNGDTLHPNAGGFKMTANALTKLLTC